VIVV